MEVDCLISTRVQFLFGLLYLSHHMNRFDVIYSNEFENLAVFKDVLLSRGKGHPGGTPPHKKTCPVIQTLGHVFLWGFTMLSLKMGFHNP